MHDEWYVYPTPYVGGSFGSENLSPSLDGNVGILKERNAALDDIGAGLRLVDNLGLEAAQELQGGLVQFHEGDFLAQTDSRTYIYV